MDTRLLELLVCPVTKGPLAYDREKQELVSRSARLACSGRGGLHFESGGRHAGWKAAAGGGLKGACGPFKAATTEGAGG